MSLRPDPTPAAPTPRDETAPGEAAETRDSAMPHDPVPRDSVLAEMTPADPIRDDPAADAPPSDELPLDASAEQMADSAVADDGRLADGKSGGEAGLPGGIEREPEGSARRKAERAQSMPRSLYGFILKYSFREQMLVLLLTALSLPFYYFSLDLPKTIINTINGKRLPKELLGYPVDQLQYLFLLCATFMAMVLINGGFKYWINVLKGRLGERMLRRLRFELYHRILRFPPIQFKRTSPGEMIPMITSEVEPLGGFIGDAFALPAQMGGTLLTAIFFLFVQDPLLGAAAVALYPLQGYLIPKLQRKVNQLGKQRVRAIRTLADRVGESVGGILEIHANDSVRLQLSDFARRLGHIYDIRYEIYQRKFFVKGLNNFINQMTPFFFYSFGGYLVIRGSLSFGSLVAVLSAYKDLADPWRELLGFYQTKEDTRIKYEQVVEQFQPPGLLDRNLQLVEPEAVPHLSGDLTLSSVVYSEDDRPHIVNGLDLTIPLDRHVAIVGSGASGKSELAMLAARLLLPSAGKLMLGEQDLAQLPYAVTGRRIAYVGAAAGLFAASLRDNLLFGLKHRPITVPKYESAEARRRAHAASEARRAGNIDFDLDADWVDYERAAVRDGSALVKRLLHAVDLVGLTDEVYALGLRGRLDAKAKPEAAARLLEARRQMAGALEARGLNELVEHFEPGRYNTNLSLGENLLFGTPTDTVLSPQRLAVQPYVQAVLDKAGLTRDLLDMGREIAETMIELFADLPAGHEFFEQFSFISYEELPDYRALLQRIQKSGMARLRKYECAMLLRLPFQLIETRHRLDLIDEAMQARIVEARRVFAEGLPAELRGKIEFFDLDRYDSAATILENVLFGSISYNAPQGPGRVNELVGELMEKLDLKACVAEVGLDYHVGSSGSRLSAIQRQKVAIARALLKRPDLLILNEATAVLDPASQQQILAMLQEEFAGTAMIAVLQRARAASAFAHIVVMDQGIVVEQGSFEELSQPGSNLSDLIEAET